MTLVTHYRFSMYGIKCSLCGMSAHSSAANWLSWLHPITPTSPFSMIQGKWYYRAEVVLTEPETAQSTRLTFPLSPLSNLPQNWKHRKKARSPRWECLSARRGNWKRVQSRGGKKRTKEGKISKRKNSEGADICAGIQKGEHFPI